MALHEGWTAKLSGDGCTVKLRDGDGVVRLHYSKLEVQDASGRELVSRLHADGPQITIVADDADAVYPVVVDPLLTSPSWTADGHQPVAGFGASVSTAGDVNGDGFDDLAGDGRSVL